VDESFCQKQALLEAVDFDGSHTGTNIAAAVFAMLEKWNLSPDIVHIALRDNAANMKKGLKDAGLDHFGCFAHTLQLVVHAGIKSQQGVLNVIATGRRIAQYFHKSPLAKDRLVQLQVSLKLPKHRILQDVQTRWNSTYYMLERLYEQRQALAAYVAEYDCPEFGSLDPEKWNLVDKIIRVLRQFEIFTREISSEASTIGDIIPIVAMIKLNLAVNNEEGTGDIYKGVQIMRSTLRNEMNERFDTNEIEKQPKLVLATLLDPRYKDKFISSAENKQQASVLLLELASQANLATVESEVAALSALPTKKARTDESTSVWVAYDAFVKKEVASSGTLSSLENIQLQNYMAEGTIDRTVSPFVWWACNKSRFDRLAIVAKKYLGAPSTSVASERLFSTAGKIYTEERNRLHADKAEKLLFVKYNMKLFAN
jgi:hAT family C-terminal dimerisation region